MKPTLLTLLTCGLLTFATQASAQQAYPDYQDGVMIFQLSLTEKLKQYDTENPLSSLPFIQRLSNKYGIQEVKFLYPNHKDDKLSRTIQVEFSQANKVLDFANEIQKLNKVEYAERKELHHTTLTPNDTYFSNSTNNGQWFLYQINAQQAWDISTGDANTIVAVTDNAMNVNHPDMVNKMLPGWDAVDSDNDPSPCGGNDGFHGSHVSGIVGAETNNNLGIASIGYDVSILPVKIGNCSSGALTAGYEGIIWAADNNADVINMSWGGSGASNYGQNVCNYAWDEGAILVAAAGNDGVSSVFYPAGYDNVVSVASSTTGDAKSGFSNYGSWIDITAPGSSILSCNQASSYQVTQGTSMASPLVAGLLGLMKSHALSATNTDIINCLYSTAVNIDGANPSYVGQLGAGRIDAYQAMVCANTYAVALDAAITEINEPEGNICSGSITPSFTLRNYGTTTLTSTTITYQINGGAAQSYNWTGNLSSTQTETIVLPTQTLTDGSYTFTVSSSSPNGNIDENMNNDSQTSNFNVISSGEQVSVNILTDCYGSETTWSIVDDNGLTVASGGPYDDITGGQQESETVCLAQGCYDFIINDSYGDGLYGSQWTCTVNGDYNITGTAGNTLVQMTATNGDFGNSTTHNFCISSPVADDAGIINVISPNGLACNPSINPIVTIQNYGNQNLTSAIITYNLGTVGNQTFNWTGNLAPNQTEDVTLNGLVGAAGSQTFTATISQPNGNSDPNANNDSESSDVTVFTNGIPLPFTEDFESGFNNQNWIIENPDADITWDIVSANGTAPGSNAARLNFFDYAQQAQRDAIITAPLSFASYTTIQMDFEHAYRRYNQNLTDSLIIYISTDCGGSYNRVFAAGEDGTGSFATATTTTSAFDPVASEWCTGTVGADCFTVNLDAYAGESSVLIKFEGYNAGTTGNNLFIDNINIDGTSVPTCPTQTSASTNITCNGLANGTIVISSSGGVQPVTYSIDGMNFGSSNTFTGVAPGTYTTFARGADGCEETQSVTISEPAALSLNVIKNDATCLDNDGTINASANGGNGSFTFSIDNGSSSQNNGTFNNLPSGTYQVVATDGNGCVSSMTPIVINAPAGPSISTTSVDETCSDANGSVTASGSNGTTPYSFSIDGGSSFQSSTLFGGLNAGNYSIIIEDANGCQATTNASLTNSGGNFTLSTSADVDICTGNSTTISASGVPNGGSYTWDNGLGSSASQTVTPTNTTIYNVIGTDVDGCSQSQSVTVTVNQVPTVAVTSTEQTICEGESVSLVASGAQSYTWNTGATGSFINVSPTTSTTYTVIGQNGSCSSAGIQTTITVNPSPTVVANATSTNVIVGDNIDFNTNGSNATTYEWNFGDGGQSNSANETYSFNTSGVYQVTLTGDNGQCSNSDVITITVSENSSDVMENILEGISIYPNPSNGTFNINTEGIQQSIGLKIYNNLGQIILGIDQLSNTITEIDGSDLANGIYIIHLESNGIYLSKRFVKH